MCGIAGLFHLDGTPVDQRMLARMGEAIAHRGPDGEEEYIDGAVGLANRRLAIIDPTPSANQPMKTDGGRLVITFNGEIFNYRQLRQKLERLGHRFRTHSDTETILLGYKAWGSRVVEKLRGQFAFCIRDRENDVLFLARDQMGVNPLFYAQTGKTFLFSSEVKGMLAARLLKKTLDPRAIHHYLSMFSIPAPFTIFQDIKSLLPGHTLTVTDRGIVNGQYWTIPVAAWRDSPLIGEEAAQVLRSHLAESVRDATVSDVPVGAFLSGGVDSSAVVALMSMERKTPVKTFSLWAQGGGAFDERIYANTVVSRFKTDHMEATVTAAQVKKELPQIIRAFDQPTGGSFETYFVSKLAGKDVKVALSGLGGDELFGGYHADIYRTRLLSAAYRQIPAAIRHLLVGLLDRLPLPLEAKKTARVADNFLSCTTALKKRLFYYFVYGEDEKKKLYSETYRHAHTFPDTPKLFADLAESIGPQEDMDMLSFVDLSTYTRDDLLLGMNMTSMANALEVRVPLLDPGLVALAARIPPSEKFRGGVSKYILKKAVKDILPREIIRHKKVGFGLPRVRYMREGLAPLVRSVLSRASINKRGIFDDEYVSGIVASFYGDTSEKMLWTEHLRVWTLFIFELWCREFLD